MVTKAVLTAVGFVAAVSLAPVRAQTSPAQQKSQATSAAPVAADTLLTAARKRARAANKQVLVVFHASWCGWCKKLDATLLNDPQMSKLLARHYEIVHLDVLENSDKKAMENPGAGKWLTTLGGGKAGLPFYAVVNPAGAKRGDSLRMVGNQNIGYPAAPEEIAAFVGLLKSTAPRMTDTERRQITEHLTRNAKHGYERE